MVRNSNDLSKIANEVRRDIIKMLLEAGSGHPAGSLSMADILVALYFGIMHHDSKNPEWKDIRIVLVTALGSEANAAKGMALGADAYIIKPFANADLIAKVKELLACPV